MSHALSMIAVTCKINAYINNQYS